MAKKTELTSPTIQLTNAQAEKFDMLEPMIASAYREMSELSKKKQDGIVNSLKIKLINRRLTEIKEILAIEPSADYLDLLEEETFLQNSDAVIILGQYQTAIDQFRKKHSGYDSGRTRWFTLENPPPRR